MHVARRTVQTSVSSCIFAHTRRLITAAAAAGNYANEKKERQRKTATRLYANNEAPNTVPAFTVQKRMPRGIAIAMI